MILIITGKSGSGKDSVYSRLINDGFERIVSTTTRPMREGEADGREYRFTDKEDFFSRIRMGEFAEYRAYNTLVGGVSDTWYYGSPKVDAVRDRDYAVVLDLEGAKKYKEVYGARNCHVVYLDVSDAVREERARKRGSFDASEWNRRRADDAVRFDISAVLETADQITGNGSLEDAVSRVRKGFMRHKESIARMQMER